MAYIDVSQYEIDNDGEIDIEISDYLDELITRKGLPDGLKELFTKEDVKCSKTSTRDAIINFLNLHIGATIEDMCERIKEIYYK
jgi:hypothetical protein